MSQKDDLISRQAAIGAVRKCSVKEVTPAFMLVDKAEVMTELMMLPSAQPEPKTGHWIYVGDGYADYCKCSECGNLSDYEENFCSYCGSDNRGKQT